MTAAELATGGPSSPTADRAGLRSLATAAVLVCLYYLLPLGHIKNVPLTLVAGVLILAAVTIWQLRAITRAGYPGVRAIEALATMPALFLFLFASAYFTMATTNRANFSAHPLTRTDTLYFTVTVFSTVKFGDITAVSQSARFVVTAEMLLDLLALGLVVRAWVGAVQLARQRARATSDPGNPPGQARQERDDAPLAPQPGIEPTRGRRCRPSATLRALFTDPTLCLLL